MQILKKKRYLTSLLMAKKKKQKKKRFKHFIGYKNEGVVTLLRIMLSKVSGYLQFFDKVKYISFAIKDKQLLKKYSKIWDKSVNIMQNELDSEPSYNGN